MDRRIELQERLEKILNSDQVFFNPPGMGMKYPAIIYELVDIKTDYADDAAYKMQDKYKITLIRKNPFGQTLYELLRIPTAQYDKRFIVDNLYHDILNIYY